MHIRSVLMTVPACAAAGALTYSFVGAQEAAPPAGYYQPRITPAQPGVVPASYIRPLASADSGAGNAANRNPVPVTRSTPVSPANTNSNWTPPTGNARDASRSRASQPVVIGPSPTAAAIAPTSVGQLPLPELGSSPVPVRQVGNTEPTIPSPKMFLPDVAPNNPVTRPVTAPQTGKLPPPQVTEIAPGSEPKPLPLVPPTSMTPQAPVAPALNPLPKAPALPSINPTEPALPTVKSSEPESPVGPRLTFDQKSTTNKISTTSPSAGTPVPLPTIGSGSVPLSPASSNVAFTIGSGAPSVPSITGSYPGNLTLSPRATPSITLDVDAPKETGLGQNLSYDLVVRNTGSTPVVNVRVEDELPTGAKFISSEPSAEQIHNRLAWTLGTLDANVEKRIKITVQPAEEGEVRTRATVNFSAAAEAHVKVTRPQVAVTLTGVEQARVGDDVVLNIRVSNTGSGLAGRILIQAKLSEGLHRPEGGVIEAEVRDLPAGESRPISLKVLATRAGSQGCTITAVADGQAPETAKCQVMVVEPLLETKLIGPSKCLVRSEPEYRIELSNPGSAATDPVQVWAIIPDGFEFVQAGDGGTFQAINRTVNWRLSGVPAGATRAVNLKLRAVSPAEGSIKTVAQANPSTGEVQPVGGRSVRVLESKAETAVRAEGVPGLRFEVIDLEDPIEVGKEAMYEIRVLNQGTGPCTNVRVTATLAEGCTATGVTGITQGRGSGQIVAFDPIPQLNTKGDAVFRVRVKGTLPGDQRFRVQVECDQIRTPIVKEESTRFYKE